MNNKPDTDAAEQVLPIFRADALVKRWEDHAMMRGAVTEEDRRRIAQLLEHHEQEAPREAEILRQINEEDAQLSRSCWGLGWFVLMFARAIAWVIIAFQEIAWKIGDLRHR